jgi:GT2 family glycosyltransferase
MRAVKRKPPGRSSAAPRRKPTRGGTVVPSRTEVAGGPLVTIVIPTFHMASFLETAILSVAAQDYPRIELIVVDGGSDPETPELVARYRHVVSRYLREPDRGQSDAINKGFRLAEGEIVAWVNADDYYFPDAVSRAVGEFQRDPALDLFYGDAVYVDREGQFLRYFTEVEPYDPDRLRSDGDFICQPTTFFPRSTLGRVGLLDDRLQYAMDWELWCRMAAAGCRFHYEQAPIAVNREYAGTKTLSGGLPRLREILEVNLRYRTRLVPRAFLDFARGELPRALPWAAPLFKVGAALVYPLILAKRAAVGRSYIKPLYGLDARSREAQRDAVVSVPLPHGAPAWVELLLGLPAGLDEQRIAVEANGRPLGVANLQDPDRTKSFRFGLGTAAAGGRLDLRLRAEVPPPGSREACFALLRVRFGDQAAARSE